MLKSQAYLFVALPLFTPLAMAETQYIPEVKKTNQTQAEALFEIDIPFLLNDSYTGDIKASVTMSGQAKLPQKRLAQLLSKQLSDEQIKQWLDKDNSQLIDLNSLRQKGLEIHFDPGTLKLSALVRRQGQQQLSLNPMRQKPNVDIEKQAKLASGLSVYINPQFIHKSSTSKNEFAPLQLDGHGFINIGGFEGLSLAYGFSFDEGARSKWQRDEITLYYDNFDTALRYSLGDLRAKSSRFLPQANLLGFSIEKDYAEIQPFRNLRPNGRSSFSLERRAIVSFQVNGIVVNQLELEAGDYNVQDFPFAAGSNDVKILVDEGSGSREIASFSSYVDTDLLARGYSLYGLSAGVKRLKSGDGFDYQDQMNLLAYWEKGVLDNLTLGSHLEYSSEHTTLGANLIWGTGIGIFAAHISGSKRQHMDSGHKSILSYSWRPAISKGSDQWKFEFNAQGEIRSDGFLSISDRTNSEGYQNISSRASLRKGNHNLSLSSNMRKSDSNKISSTTFSYSSNFSDYSFSLAFQHQRDDRESENAFILSLSKRLQNGTIRARSNTSPMSSSLEWYQPSSRYVGSSSSRVRFNNGDSSRDFEANYSYIANRAEFDLRSRAQQLSGDSGISSASTQARIGLGFGYADNNFSFGRPFSNGFVILKAHDNIRQSNIQANRGSPTGPNLGHTGNWGSTLVPLSGSYREQQIVVEVSDLPIGYDIGEGQLKAFPSHYSGFVYQVGSDSANTVLGKLLNAKGEPLALIAGYLMNTYTKEKTDFFTNRSGRFVAEKMSPGTYLIVLKPEDQVMGSLEVPEGTPGLIQLGKVQLK